MAISSMISHYCVESRPLITWESNAGAKGCTEDQEVLKRFLAHSRGRALLRLLLSTRGAGKLVFEISGSRWVSGKVWGGNMKIY
jgi:hypothetical protein